jgi:hypothetical protein
MEVISPHRNERNSCCGGGNYNNILGKLLVTLDMHSCGSDVIARDCRS